MVDDTEELDTATLIAQQSAALATKLAAEHVPACIGELVNLTKIAGRPNLRRRAAVDLIRIATQLKTAQSTTALTQPAATTPADRPAGHRRRTRCARARTREA